MKKLTIIIPALNEEKGIGLVIDGIPEDQLKLHGYTAEVLVVDNNSVDRTAAIALQKGAKVVTAPNKGKGSAVIKGFKSISPDTDYVVLIDADNTYKLHEVMRLLEPLHNGFCSAIAGSRMGGKILDGSVSFSHRLGNWLFSFLVRSIYKANVTDALTGYFAFRRDVIEELIPHLRSTDFSIEMEIITKLVKLGHAIYSVPITYDKRKGHSKLETFSDGFKISKMFIRNLNWVPVR